MADIMTDWTQVDKNSPWWELTKQCVEPNLDQPGWVNDSNSAFIYSCYRGGYGVIAQDERKNISDTWAWSLEAAEMESEFLLDELEEEGGFLGSILRALSFFRN